MAGEPTVSRLPSSWKSASVSPGRSIGPTLRRETHSGAHVQKFTGYVRSLPLPAYFQFSLARLIAPGPIRNAISIDPRQREIRPCKGQPLSYVVPSWSSQEPFDTASTESHRLTLSDEMFLSCSYIGKRDFSVERDRSSVHFNTWSVY